MKPTCGFTAHRFNPVPMPCTGWVASFPMVFLVNQSQLLIIDLICSIDHSTVRLLPVQVSVYSSVDWLVTRVKVASPDDGKWIQRKNNLDCSPSKNINRVDDGVPEYRSLRKNTHVGDGVREYRNPRENPSMWVIEYLKGPQEERLSCGWWGFWITGRTTCGRKRYWIGRRKALHLHHETLSLFSGFSFKNCGR